MIMKEMASYKSLYAQAAGPRAAGTGDIPFHRWTVGASWGCKGYLCCSWPISCIVGCAYVHVCVLIWGRICAWCPNVQSDPSSSALASFLWMQRDYPAVFGSLAELRVFVSSQAEYVCFLSVQSDRTHWACVWERGRGGRWRPRSGGLLCCGPCRPSLLGISTCYAAKRELGPGWVFLPWFSKENIRCTVEIRWQSITA